MGEYSNAACLALLGILLVSAGLVVRKIQVMDAVANVDFAYLAVMLGLASMCVALHCALFSARVSALPFWPNLVLFVIIACAANINVVWDGVVLGVAKKEILLSLANSAEFSIYYAAMLFLPRLVTPPVVS